MFISSTVVVVVVVVVVEGVVDHIDVHTLLYGSCAHFQIHRVMSHPLTSPSPCTTRQ